MAKRLYYYLIGFTIGAFFIYFILVRGRSFDFWMPGERVKEELIQHKPIISEKAHCYFSCINISSDSIIAVIKKSKVNFNKSKPREKPCRFYVLEEAKGKTEMIFSVCDSVVTLVSITTVDSCDCN